VLQYLPANLPRHEIATELSVPVNTGSPPGSGGLFSTDQAGVGWLCRPTAL